MKKISATELTDLLNDGFEGDVKFSGRFFLTLPSSDFGINGNHIYEARGDFTLSSLSPPGTYDLRCDQGNQNHRLLFSLGKNKKADHVAPELYGHIISVPVHIGVDANLQIEPKEIRY